MKVVDYIPQPAPHDAASEDSDSNANSDADSCSKSAASTGEGDTANPRDKKHKQKLSLKINTESFYGTSTPNCAPQTSPMPPSPKVSRLADSTPVSPLEPPNSVENKSSSLPPVSTESASPSAVSNIWRAVKSS